MKILRMFDSFKFVRAIFVAVACAFAFAPAHAATLPTGYTELEYIESSGKQYIDTGYKPNANTELTGKIWAKTGSKYIYGTGSSPTAFTAYVQGRWRFADKYFSTSSVFNLNTDYTFKHNKEGIWLNDTKVGSFSSPANFTANYNLYLFATHTTSVTYGTGVRIYNLQIKDNGVLVRDFVPARRNSDGMIGMYDVVNWIFYPNKGTTAFSVGGDVVSPIKIATTKYNETKFAPVETQLDAARTTINNLITQMQTNAINVSKLAVEKQTRPNADCPAGKNCLLVIDPTGAENWYVIAGADDVETAPADYFAFTVIPFMASYDKYDDNGDYVEYVENEIRFAFGMTPSGTFTIDWGDGSEPQVVNRPTVTDLYDSASRYSHSYTTGGNKTIKITGRATGYSSSDPVIIFDDYELGNESYSFVMAIDGSLGAIFPTLGNGAGQQPNFRSVFALASIKSIPENLFRGVTGAAPYMFSNTFDGTQITSIPAGLFSGVTGAAPYMFSNTFDGTQITSIPAGLFSGVTGAAEGMFSYTFYGTQITSIPENLFSGVTGAADHMFEGTFSRTPITSIPAGLFSGVTGAAPGMFSGTFGFTPITSIPAGLFSGVTGAANGMFRNTFYNCPNLTGYIPESTFAGLIQNNSPDASDFMYYLVRNSNSMATTCPQNTTEVQTPYSAKYWSTGNGNAVMCRPN